MISYPLHELPIRDLPDYEQHQIQLLESARALLERLTIKAEVVDLKPGLARLLNLSFWHPNHQTEYLDSKELTGDLLIHIACHQLIHLRFGSQDTAYRILGEVLASASDLYLVGLFAQAVDQEETEFLAETIESFHFYYETYGSLTALESVLEQCIEHPFETFTSLALYLNEFVQALLFPAAEMERVLADLSKSPFYPLVHHYHLANWVVSLRGSQPPNEGSSSRVALFFQELSQGEAYFLNMFHHTPTS